MDKVSIYEVYRLHAGTFFTDSAGLYKGFSVSKHAYRYQSGYLFISSQKSRALDARFHFIEFCDRRGWIQLADPAVFVTEKAARARIAEIIANGESVNEDSTNTVPGRESTAKEE